MDRLGAKRLEKIIKGVSNHWRIRVLFLLGNKPGLSLDEINEELGASYKTMAEHTKRLEVAGLIKKNYVGRTVVHKTTKLGIDILTFLRM